MVIGMSGAGASDASRRVWARLPEGARSALAERLSPTDLQTVLLEVAKMRAEAVTPAELVRRWRNDRFVRPATCDPRALAAVEAQLWRLLPPELDGVELSPVVPLGTCSAVGPVSQNRVVSTVRSTEVLSDATNALAIEAAVRRQQQPRSGEVHLAASHRHLRAQVFGAGMSAHFRLFVLVSSARDVGSGVTQARLLALHLNYWRAVLAALAPAASPRVEYTVFDSSVVQERLNDTVLPGLTKGPDAAVPVVEESGRARGRAYYIDAALRVTAQDGAEFIELGDGGFTTWTAQLMSDAKERCLVSCLATERLAALTASTG